MDESKRIRKELRDDYEKYARNCLKIRTKDGRIDPFMLNKAQLHIHKIVEKQKRETGKVRAIILKGRQQGCCFSPGMKVLTADYRWVTLHDIEVGERLVACDENTDSGKKQSRKFKTAIVEAKREFRKEILEITLDNGARLRLTKEHKMLCKQRGGCLQLWREAGKFKVGDYIRVVTRPPNYECNTYEDGWMGGIIDGEGSARLTGAKRISVHQVAGPVLDRMKAYFDKIKIHYKEVIDSRESGVCSKLGKKPVHRLDVHRMPYLIELFARCRPARFTKDEWHLGHELPGKGAQDGIKPWAKIISIKELPQQRVIDLQTSEKTYVCEGLVSHNSTYVEGRFYWLTSHRFGVRAFILAHEEDATRNLFEMAKRYHEHCPSVVRPDTSASNAKELVFSDLDSGYRLGTAGNKGVGRSSTIQYLHCSEVGYYKNARELAMGIMQAVPGCADTELFLESTANGIGNYFFEQWQMAEAGMSDFIPIFVPWFWQPEYFRSVPMDFKPTEEEAELKEFYTLTNEQIMWRRLKIVDLSVGDADGAKLFRVEYPNTPVEAFSETGEDSYIHPDAVMRARKTECDPFGPLVVGVDPARFGDDRTCIIRRRGRVAFGLERYVKKDLMEVTGYCYKILTQENPRIMAIDTVGLGAGVYDRLIELGFSRDVVISCNSGSTPLDTSKYVNKRAECWALMKMALDDHPCQLPDSDELHADLCGLRYEFDSQNRLKLERKEAAKKRGVRSPDAGDALALTYFVPPTRYQREDKEDSRAAFLMQRTNELTRLKKAGS